MRFVVRSVLMVAGVLLSCSSAAAEKNLRIATFNINYGNVDLPDIQRVITTARADVVCIQESTRQSEAFLKRVFGKTYPHMTFKGFRHQYAAERFGFLSKVPLHELQYDPPVDGLFGTYFVSIKHNNRLIRIANVHLSPFMVRRGSGFRQAWRDISAAEVVHTKEIQRIAARLDSRPTLVCGDFNSLSTFTAPKKLVSLGFTDSFAKVTEDADSKPTWHWPVAKFDIQLRIDYIFHTAGFKTVTSKIIPTTGSDHFLLVTEVAGI